MIKLGDYNTLKIVKRVDFGMYLDGGDDGEILLPTRYVPEGAKVGQKIEVFLYLDQDEKLIATTLHPLAKVGEFAWLECAWTNEYGAFLNWGLMKDLFCPFREQKQRMQKGQRYYVYIMEDEKTHRLMATAKVERYQKHSGYERALDFSEELIGNTKSSPSSCPCQRTIPPFSHLHLGTHHLANRGWYAGCIAPTKAFSELQHRHCSGKCF